MADSRDDPELFLVDPERRGIFPLDAFHVPKRLQRTLRQAPYRITADTAFAEVLAACAAPAPDRPSTWINAHIFDLYTALHAMGCAHSVECWQDGALVGGLYGVHIGGAFFGESMFSHATDASKIALVTLAERLRQNGFTLLDAQFHTPHLAQFGLIEVGRADFKRRLREALKINAEF
jgi:leucyl/phenylalanyl-tRNA---protein transferase